jgi:bifunctional non-homologous end joining protein LigD
VHRRSDDWVKLKCVQREEFVIGGYTWPDESRSDPGIGALLVGQFDGTGTLQYAGKVGTGFTWDMSAQLRQRLDALAQPKRPFAGPTGHDRWAQWVRPELVCEVAYNEWPERGSLRAASFKGLRQDKPAVAIGREVAAAAAPTKGARTNIKPHTIPGMKGQLRVTHGDRIMDASSGLTKLDLVRYYADVAAWALPHLKGRHVYVARFPEGIEGVRIFQQHPDGMPGLSGTDPALWPEHEPAVAIDSVGDLVAAAQLSVVEFHTWNSRAKAIQQPDRVIFDLDPGEGVPWSHVLEAAVLTRAMLSELGLKSWLKTTGGKGLHVVVPIEPEVDYDTAKAFTQAVVHHMARTIPQRFVSVPGPARRKQRIFIDFLRNGQSQSTAAAFSARARPGLPVSMPIMWEELPDVKSGAEWNIANALSYLQRLKMDPWAGYWKARQSLIRAIEALG